MAKHMVRLRTSMYWILEWPLTKSHASAASAGQFDSHGNDESNRIFAEVLFLGVLRTVDIQQAEGP